MRRALAAFALLAASASARAQDVAPEERAFVEIVASKPQWFVGETIRLRLRVGYDREYFGRHVVQTFQQRLDVPVRVEASWLRRPTDVALVAADTAVPRSSTRYSYALDDSLVTSSGVGPETRKGRTYSVLEIEWTYRAFRAGEVVVPEPTLRFAHAERFEDDFVHGRTPVGRRDVVVRGAAPTFHVVELPAEGRPSEFSGAVGKFDVRASADRDETAVGDAVKLTLMVFGADSDAVDPPRLAGLSDFHVYGMVEETPAWGRCFVYDVAPLDDRVTEIPPIAFAYFDPDTAEYRVVKTDAIPLRVRPSPKTAHVEPRATEDAGPSRWPIALAVAAALAAVAIIVLRRGRNRTPREAAGGHVREAAATFRASPDSSLADAFTAFVAACLRCPPASVISPDLAARLAVAGVPSDVADRAAALLERLVAARYGGDSSAGDVAAARALVDEVETALSHAED